MVSWSVYFVTVAILVAVIICQHFHHKEWKRWVIVQMGEATASRLGLE